jgi:hypothetical protein
VIAAHPTFIPAIRVGWIRVRCSYVNRPGSVPPSARNITTFGSITRGWVAKIFCVQAKCGQKNQSPNRLGSYGSRPVGLSLMPWHRRTLMIFGLRTFWPMTPIRSP